MLLTTCTLRQLPQALALGANFAQYHPDLPVVIGLADDGSQLPPAHTIPFPVITAADCLGDQLPALSAQYTPAEFAAACKPAFIRTAFERYPAVNQVLYADPSIRIYQSLDTVFEKLTTHTLLITPHITQPLTDNFFPDEKYFQNTGLYSTDFLAFRRSAETDRLLTWWQDRVTTRAAIDYCAGLCLDQIWLMHALTFFEGVGVVKDPAWHVAVWNFHERWLTQEPQGWRVNGQSRLLFANFKGLDDPDEGLFPYQNRFRLANRPDVQPLLQQYRQYRQGQLYSDLYRIPPAYGLQPEPVIVRGWRRHLVQSIQKVNLFIDSVPLPAIKR
ncbi:hypothetical protein GCM10023189_41460 [Nibrella saemangeumensis]|uniref:Uncharacterized protein n=1 Tax=Nibrella saemangeumensis TaxID=1084526 RepID=A0ABP8NDD2_9BACT